MCQDYGEYQELESGPPISILLERLKPRARRGSKPRCHWLTHGSHDAVAVRLADLVAPFASVASSDYWMPQGFEHTAEAQLGYADRFLTADRRAALTRWWLAVPRQANTPIGIWSAPARWQAKKRDCCSWKRRRTPMNSPRLARH